MKLRIKDNSLRFRLTQREVTRLKENGRVEAEVRFTPDRDREANIRLRQLRAKERTRSRGRCWRRGRGVRLRP